MFQVGDKVKFKVGYVSNLFGLIYFREGSDMINDWVAYNIGYEDALHNMNRRKQCKGFEDDYDEGYAEVMDDQENEINNSGIITNDVDSF